MLITLFSCCGLLDRWIPERGVSGGGSEWPWRFVTVTGHASERQLPCQWWAQGRRPLDCLSDQTIPCTLTSLFSCFCDATGQPERKPAMESDRTGVLFYVISFLHHSHILHVCVARFILSFFFSYHSFFYSPRLFTWQQATIVLVVCNFYFVTMLMSTLKTKGKIV